jgi:hypothetical protein
VRLRCANCRRVMLPEDKATMSNVYGTHGSCLLCDSCAEYEKEKIDEAKTNHVPALYVLYVSAAGSKQVELG